MKSEYEFSDFTEEESRDLERRREALLSVVEDQPLDSTEAKLELIQGAFDDESLDASQVFLWECLGVLLGDALVERGGVQWKIIDNEMFDRMPCLVVEGTAFALFPIHMLLKRAEEGELLEVEPFFKKLCEMVDEERRRGKASKNS